MKPSPDYLNYSRLMSDGGDYDGGGGGGGDGVEYGKPPWATTLFPFLGNETFFNDSSMYYNRSQNQTWVGFCGADLWVDRGREVVDWYGPHFSGQFVLRPTINNAFNWVGQEKVTDLSMEAINWKWRDEGEFM